MSAKTELLVDALKLSAEQNKLAQEIFTQLIDVFARNAHGEPSAGVAICVAATTFLIHGLEIGFENGHLSEEQLRIFVGAFTKLLPKTS